MGMREKCLGPNHPGVATALVNLAVIYCQHVRYKRQVRGMGRGL